MPETLITGDDLRRVRKLRGLTRQRMAEALGWGHSNSVYKAEVGLRNLGGSAVVVIQAMIEELKAEGLWEEH